MRTNCTERKEDTMAVPFVCASFAKPPTATNLRSCQIDTEQKRKKILQTVADAGAVSLSGRILDVWFRHA